MSDWLQDEDCIVLFVMSVSSISLWCLSLEGNNSRGLIIIAITMIVSLYT